MGNIAPPGYANKVSASKSSKMRTMYSAPFNFTITKFA